MLPVARFYRVRFPDERAMRDWADRVQEFATKAEGLESGAIEPRPVVFVPLLPRRTRAAVAYVSDGARGLALALATDAELDQTGASLRELPDGLSLLCGDGRDAATYERRSRRGPGGDGSA